MTTFVVVVTLGNDAMKDAVDVAGALDDAGHAAMLAQDGPGVMAACEPRPIRDANGNTVGSWQVVE